MKKKIIHTLVYTYEIPVSLEEHLICLKPRSNSFQELSNFDLQILPSPYSTFPLLSDNGDDIFKVLFTGSTNSLKIKTESGKDIAKRFNISFLKKTEEEKIRLVLDKIKNCEK